jgi:hypothetical protein
MAANVKNPVFWDVGLCGSYKNRRFGGTGASIIRVTRTGELGPAATFLRSVLRLLLTANVFRNSPIFVTMMMEATLSS